MKSNLEIEYKMLVEKDIFEQMIHAFNLPSVEQTNVYYDRRNRSLKQDGMGMRIRDCNQKHTFTLKVKRPEGHDEYEVFVSQNSLEALKSEPVLSIFKHLNIEGPFIETGRLTTSRTEIPFQYGTLCLDRNDYYNVTDYELEFEVFSKADSEKGMQEFKSILNRFQLTFKHNKRSKIQRCLEEKEKLNMKKTAIFCANGFEECEGLVVADLLKRADIGVQLVSMQKDLMVTSSHQIKIQCDLCFEDVDFSSLDMIILPGGMPGTTHLKEHAPLCSKIIEFDQQGKGLAAICAAPSVFGSLGLLKNRKVTCYPGFEEECLQAIYTGNKTETDGHFITARGLGTALEFSAKIIEALKDKATADNVLKEIQY